MIDQPLEQLYRAVGRIACQPLRPKTKAPFDTLHHGLRGRNLNCAIGTGALGVEDDPNLVVDQIVRVVGKQWVNARPRNPCRLGIGQRDFFGWLASTVAAARIATVAVSLFFIIVSRIESREIFANGTRCLLRLRPNDRLISGDTPGLVHICLDQARIDRKRFTADQPRRDARRHHTLKYPPQGITLTKALMPGAAEHRMIGNPVLDGELAKPPVRKVDLHLGANLTLRADRKYVTHKQHPDHQHRIDRGSTGVRVVRRKLLVHPTQIENVIDLAYHMVRRHHLIEIKGIKELTLAFSSTPHHASLPPINHSIERNHGSQIVSM